MAEQPNRMEHGSEEDLAVKEGRGHFAVAQARNDVGRRQRRHLRPRRHSRGADVRQDY